MKFLNDKENLIIKFNDSKENKKNYTKYCSKLEFFPFLCYNFLNLK